MDLPDTRHGNRRNLRIIALCGSALVVIVMLCGYWNMQQDDSYIFYTYARNLADGHGFVFNAGERVNATTSPLYTILLAIPYKLSGFLPFLTLPVIGHIIGGLSLLGLCYFLVLCFGAEDQNSLFPYALPLVFLANPLLSGAFGMELFLAMMLAVASISMYCRSRLAAASLLASLAALARPDMLIVPGLLLVHHWIRHRRLPGLRATLLFVVPIGAWLLFSWFYFGSILPSTLAAKLAQTEAKLWGGELALLEALFSAPTWYGAPVAREQALPLVTLLFMVGAGSMAGLAIWMVKRRDWQLLHHPAVQVLAAWSLLHLIAYGLFLRVPAYPWYYTPLSAGLAVLMTLSLEAMMRQYPERSDVRWRTGAAALLLVLTLIGLWLPSVSLGKRSSAEYDIHRKAAQWLNEHAREGASVGAGDIDILRFFYEKGPVIDGLGLVTPAVVDHVRKGDLNWYICEYEPDYLMLPVRRRPAQEDLAYEDWFRRSYELQTVVGDAGQEVALYGRVPQNGAMPERQRPPTTR
jgi:arabinofuranosyltransferase